MSDLSKIEWTDATWNPTAGCDPAGPGCLNCYAARMAKRLAGMGQQKYEGTVDDVNGRPVFNGRINFAPDEALSQPLKWKEPRRIFVNSMSDLFHESIPFDFVDKVFEVMWATPRHTYQILTKRPGRMVDYIYERARRRAHGWTDLERVPFQPGDFFHFEDMLMRNECGYLEYEDGREKCLHPKSKDGDCDSYECPVASRVCEREKLKLIGVEEEYEYDDYGCASDCEWMEIETRPYHAACWNVWLGFSASNQQDFEKQFREFSPLRHKLGPYFKLFCSLEPLVGPIDFRMKWHAETEGDVPDSSALERYRFQGGGKEVHVPYLDWVIVGGESGPKARRCETDWIRSIVKQCREAKVPVFVKQLGADPWIRPGENRLKDSKGGDPAEWPADLRVREIPEVKR